MDEHQKKEGALESHQSKLWWARHRVQRTPRSDHGSEREPTEIDAHAEMEKIRKGLEAHREEVAHWEASSKKRVAELLDGLGELWEGWETVSAKLSELQSRLKTAQREGERLGDARTRSASELSAEREALAHARTELVETQRRLEAVARERDTLARAQETLTKTSADLAEARRELEQAERRNLADQEQARREMEQLRAECDRLERARRELEAAPSATVSDDEVVELKAELQKTQARLKSRKEQCASLERETEQNLVVICDFRVKVNRLEKKVEEKKEERRTKLRKILDKVHAELDAAGVPRGDEVSFGERIRWLKQRIEDLEASLR